jgi:hypothetical protein
MSVGLHDPEFLTPQLKGRNLLTNPSFESTGTTAWTVSSFLSNPNAVRIVQDKGHDGRLSSIAYIESIDSDDVAFKQAVSVKPQTDYLFSGWAKWEDVVIEQDRTIGVNLCQMGTWNRGGGILQGSQGWTYLTFAFNSGEKTMIDLAVRLGFYSNVTKGKAWFDDMCLIELPKPKANDGSL